MTADWPVELSALTEAVIATRGPDGRWQLAALGLEPGSPVTARTWGRTRTRRNLERAGGGIVQFTRDPVDFVEAAIGEPDAAEPVLDSAAAWAEVEAERLGTGTDAGTEWADWALRPVEAAVLSEAVPTVERGFNAVVEATVDASRLGVAGYDEAALRERLARHRAVVERCGGERDRRAMARLDELLGG